MPVRVGAVRKAQGNRHQAHGKLRPSPDEAPRDHPDQRCRPDLDHERERADGVAQPEDDELERAHLHARVREDICPVGREEPVSRCEEERKVAGVARVDEERDGGRAEEEDRGPHLE